MKCLILQERNNHEIIRFWVILLALFWTISLPCFASLTQEDMRQIREIIREEIEPVKKEIVSVKLEVATIKGDIKALEAKMTTLEAKMATKDDLLSLWKDMMGKIETLYGLIIGVLIAIIVSVVLAPVFQKWLERRKISNNEERFHKIEVELEELKAIMGATEGKKRL